MSNPLNILIVEDSEDDTLLLLRELRRGGYEPLYERVETAAAMRAALARQAWDVVVADYNLPHFNALAALNVLQASGLDPPFIIISGTVGEDIAVAAMKAGAHDYLRKGRLARLIPAIERELREVQVRRERQQAEAHLKQTLADLARSNADLEQFASAVSHDLQEPLRGVSGTVQLLQRRYQGQLDARADEIIEHAVERVSRMQALIRDLLARSRVSRQGQPFGPVDCTLTLEKASANLTAAMEESGAVISHDPLPSVMAAPTQLFQNLMGNALKFRGDRPPTVHLSATRQAGGWQFAVRDNGIGIDPADAERIFGVFQRLHTHRDYPGTGIGLALCKKIVERHGGRLWVESKPGQGSLFYFTLPEIPISLTQEIQPL